MPVRRSWLAEPRAQCEGRPRHGRRRRRRARRIRERGRTDLNGGGVGGADGGATQAAWLAGTAWWLGRPGWRLTRHPRAAQLESARARRRWATCLVATCARGSVSCECATHCAASHAASRRGSCQSPLVGGHHPRLLARTGTPASLQPARYFTFVE